MNIIPTSRILDKLDYYLSKKEFDSAEKLLNNWANEAQLGKDVQGKLTILNEQIGLYRKRDKMQECLLAIEAALQLVSELGFSDTVTGATTYINAATGYKAFGMADRALPLYRQAKNIYEKSLALDDERLAALYNNMALTLTQLKAYEEAGDLYEKAINVLMMNEHSKPDMAITYLNLADMANSRYGPEEAEKYVYDYLDRAEELLDAKDIPTGSYYAYVCEKCAPVFDHYGYFMAKQKLEQRAREIYERT